MTREYAVIANNQYDYHFFAKNRKCALEQVLKWKKIRIIQTKKVRND